MKKYWKQLRKKVIPNVVCYNQKINCYINYKKVITKNRKKVTGQKENVKSIELILILINEEHSKRASDSSAQKHERRRTNTTLGVCDNTA